MSSAELGSEKQRQGVELDLGEIWDLLNELCWHFVKYDNGLALV